MIFVALWAQARRRFESLGLAAQSAWAGGAVALACGVGAWFAARPEAAVAAAAAALLATLATALLARRNARSLRRVAGAARTLTRDDAPEEREIPYEDANAELLIATGHLRRMVEAARRRQRELEARNLALSHQLESRTHELTTLQDLSIGLASKSDLHELVDEALAALEQTMEYTSASLWSREPGRGPAAGPVVLMGYRTGLATEGPLTENLTGMRLSRENLRRYEQIERERAPIVENNPRQSLFSWLWSRITDDARSSSLYRASRSWMALPLAARERVLGVMRVDHGEPGYFDPERARLLSAVSSQTALAMHHAQLLAQERDVAVMAERNRIARELHDAVSQTLFAANLMAGTLSRAARGEAPDAQAIARQAQSLETLNRSALAEMRLLMFELRPDALASTPLADLLGQAVEAIRSRGEIEVRAELSRSDDLPADVRVQVYRIAQEALSNVARHSGATRVELTWQTSGPGRALLRVADNGRGFDPGERPAGHFGLENMQSRAEEIGAAFSLTSVPGAGAELRVELGAAKESRDAA